MSVQITHNRPLITEDYRALNAELHVLDNYWGRTNPLIGKMACNVAQRYGCKTVLDYGCGKGTLPEYLGGLRVALYDPCVPGFDAPPEPADLVVCSAVMEHVEFYSLWPVMDQIRDLAQKAVLFTITTVSSSKFLSDGRNCHVTCHPIEWWIPGLINRWTPKAMENHGSWFWYIGKRK